jgi:hypothetical protein
MNIGIVIPHTGSSQIAFHSIKEINRLIDNNYLDDIVLFFEHLVSPIIMPKCAKMDAIELSSFTGHIITTTINTTVTAISRNSNRINKIIYYVWDLEWMRPQKNVYLYNYYAFNQVNKIISRSINHAKAIENYSNRKVDKIIEEFNIEEILK